MQPSASAVTSHQKSLNLEDHFVQEAFLLYRALGQTGLEVSAIGFGASTLGNVFGNVSREEGDLAVRTAIDEGINFFDTSPYYGLSLAEQRLGEALGTRRNEILLATKCGRYGAEHFDFSAVTITREFESSLRRLRTDHVDLLQVHDVEFGSVEQIVHETLPAMRLLQQQGKARFIGITSYWPGLLVSIAKRFEVDTILNYCHGNLLIDDINEELIPFAQKHGVAVINASPLHMGLLGGAPVAEWHPAPAAVRHAAVEIQLCCEEFGLRPATVALAWCLVQQQVATTLVGISRVRELEDALSGLRMVVPRELLERIRQIAAPVAHITWPSGLIENQPSSVLHAR